AHPRPNLASRFLGPGLAAHTDRKIDVVVMAAAQQGRPSALAVDNPTDLVAVETRAVVLIEHARFGLGAARKTEVSDLPELQLLRHEATVLVTSVPVDKIWQRMHVDSIEERVSEARVEALLEGGMVAKGLRPEEKVTLGPAFFLVAD